MQTVIRLDGITAGYDGRPQIRDVTLAVGDREFVGIIGPNGGGKTTLLRVVLGLLKPMGGTLSYYRGGVETGRLRKGYLPQNNAIDKDFPISVYDTVLSGLNGEKRLFSRFTAGHHRRVESVLRSMMLDGMGSRPVKALSGGELQRVLLARAVVSEPEVLVLDEPNTYIDSRSERQMYDMIDSLRLGRAIIMVSHDTEYITGHADTVIYVDETVSRRKPL